MIFAYLCVFDPRGWQPIAWGNIEKDEAVFKTFESNIVYHTALYKERKLELAGNPFLLDTLLSVFFFDQIKQEYDNMSFISIGAPCSDALYLKSRLLKKTEELSSDEFMVLKSILNIFGRYTIRV